jgi:hydroxymethylpyrimidine/phosphomethylpyrimidine kinase
MTIPVALTIAGSDSGGGAGIQADLRTFAFHCVHGTSALTCVTAQNTLGVTRVDALPPDAVVAQIQAVVTDIGVQGVKTGMLLNTEIISAVAQQLDSLNSIPIVVDPVMVSRTGAQLIDDTAVATLRDQLLPLATLVTPNRYEAQLLTGLEIHSLADMKAAAQRIYQFGSQAVLVKGGAMSGELRGLDVGFDGNQFYFFKTQRIDTLNTHGTGCTLSSAIVANLCLKRDIFSAVERGKLYLTTALEHSLSIGKGQGPVGHFYPLLSSRPKD